MPKLLSKKELADFWGISKKTVERMEKEGLPVYSQKPKRYDLEKAQKWLKNRNK